MILLFLALLFKMPLAQNNPHPVSEFELTSVLSKAFSPWQDNLRELRETHISQRQEGNIIVFEKPQAFGCTGKDIAIANEPGENFNQFIVYCDGNFKSDIVFQGGFGSKLTLDEFIKGGWTFFRSLNPMLIKSEAAGSVVEVVALAEKQGFQAFFFVDSPNVIGIKFAVEELIQGERSLWFYEWRQGSSAFELDYSIVSDVISPGVYDVIYKVQGGKVSKNRLSNSLRTIINFIGSSVSRF